MGENIQEMLSTKQNHDAESNNNIWMNNVCVLIYDCCNVRDRCFM